MGLAEGGQSCADVEGVNFNLVNGGENAGLGVEEFLELYGC